LLIIADYDQKDLKKNHKKEGKEVQRVFISKMIPEARLFICYLNFPVQR